MPEDDRSSLIHIFGDSQVVVYRDLGLCRSDTGEGGSDYRIEVTRCRVEDPSALKKSTGPGLQALREDLAGTIRAQTVYAEEGGGKCLQVFSAGSHHMHQLIYKSGLFETHDFVLPGLEPLVSPDRPLIPFRLVRETAMEYLNELQLSGWIEALMRHGAGCDFVLAPPPPHREDGHVNRTLGPFRPEGRSFPIIPLNVRTKIHRLFSSLMSEICSGFDVPLLEMWKEAAPDHALLPCYELDGCHANTEFAKAVVVKMIRTRKITQPAGTA